MVALFLLFVLLITSCSDRNDHTGIETTNGLQIYAMHTDSTPALGAVAYLIRPGDFEGVNKSSGLPILDSAIIDKNGFVDFGPIQDTIINLYIRKGNEVLLLNYNEENPIPDSDSETVFLQKSATITGHVSGLDPAFVYIEGIPVKSGLDSTGGFKLTGVPATTVAIMAADTGNPIYLSTLTLTPSQILDSQELQAKEYYLIEDFEDGDSYNLTRPFTQGGFWDVLLDTIADSSIQIIPYAAINATGKAITSGTEAYQGKSSQLQFIFGSNADTNTLAGFSSYLNHKAPFHFTDMSTLDSIVFYAKGKGRFWMQLFSGTVGQEFNSRYKAPHVGALLQLNESWTRISIPTSEIRQVDDSTTGATGLTFADVATKIRSIDFIAKIVAGDTATLWLDDIRFYGIHYSVFQ